MAVGALGSILLTVWVHVDSAMALKHGSELAPIHLPATMVKTALQLTHLQSPILEEFRLKQTSSIATHPVALQDVQEVFVSYCSYIFGTLCQIFVDVISSFPYITFGISKQDLILHFQCYVKLEPIIWANHYFKLPITKTYTCVEKSVGLLYIYYHFFLGIVAGGVDKSNSPTNIVETYYPAQNCTVRIQDTPIKCSNPMLCYVGGKIYLGINDVLTRLYTYNPVANNWIKLGKDSVYDHPSQPYSCGSRYICVMDDNYPECFDTTTQTWITYPYIPYITGAQSCMVETNGKIYIFGGTKTAPVQYMDLVSQAWTVTTTYMPTPSVMEGCYVIPGQPNNILVVVYGATINSCIYNTLTNTFVNCTKKTVDLSQADIVPGFDGKQLYSFVFTGIPYTGAYAYCPKNSTTPWQKVPLGTAITERYYSSVLSVPCSIFPTGVIPTGCKSSEYTCN